MYNFIIKILNDSDLDEEDLEHTEYFLNNHEVNYLVKRMLFFNCQVRQTLAGSTVIFTIQNI
jgi:hypothetical protein